MAFCSQCGAKLPEDGRFCVKCGALVSPQAIQVVLPRKKRKVFRVLLWIVIPLLLVGIAAGFLFRSDEQMIEDRLNSFAKAYTQGDSKGLMKCLDTKMRNAGSAGSSLAGSALSKLLGFSVDMNGLWSIGVALINYEMEIDIASMDIDGDEATVRATITLKWKDFLSGQSSQKLHAVFEMVKEGYNWYIHDIKEQ